MIDLIRSLLDRPLDRRHARAIIAIASCLTLSFAALVGFGVIAGSRPTPNGTRKDGFGRPAGPPPPSAEGSPHVPDSASRPPTVRRNRRQDPQDRRGSAAYHRARRTLHDHRALQHLPFRRRGLSITLVGADRGRAIVWIVAPTVAEAKHRWRGFLRRLGDDGSSYETHFHARPRRIAGRPRKDREEDRGGDRGPDRGRIAENATDRHHQPARGAGDFLKSTHQPKRSP